MNDTMQIGAGTVLDADAAKAAIEAGARFIISPCVVPEVISVTKRYGAVSVPGAFTPTEIVNAHNSGGDIIKVFPSSSNAMYIREILAPLPHIPLIQRNK
jgi:2-dehydro-3-deoxyphosphogluconate aldolase/(4S)-4-hydroxy-2-oxoglutarate aldolase